MSFRNVDGSSELMESERAQFYSRILVANSHKRQRGYSEKQAQPGLICSGGQESGVAPGAS